jgi:hypothetical protein
VLERSGRRLEGRTGSGGRRRGTQPREHFRPSGAALRAYGEFSPWSFSATKERFASGRPRGVQAIAAHGYHTMVAGIARIPQQAAWAALQICRSGALRWVLPCHGPTPPKWAVADTWSSWNALVTRIVGRSPDLQMTSYYHDPGL